MIMARKGPSRHQARIALPRRLPVKGRKGNKWVSMPSPGPHPKRESVSLLVLLRDVLGIAKGAAEAKRVIKSGGVAVDGRVARNERHPVGLMDIVAVREAKKSFRMLITRSGLSASGHEGAGAKLCRIVRKHTARGGKTVLTFHDGRNCIGDDKLRVGDSVTFEFGSRKISAVHKLAPGARCLVVSGKHAGALAVLDAILERKGSMGNEAKMKGERGEFITALKYLFVVDDKFGK